VDCANFENSFDLFDPALDAQHEEYFYQTLPSNVVQIDSDSESEDEPLVDEEEELGDDGATMKQKESYLHQIGFFLRDIDGQPIKSSFKPVDFSSLTLEHLGIDPEGSFSRSDFGVVQDLQRQAAELNGGTVDRRPNWAKVSFPQGANLKLKEPDLWPQVYTNFDWPAELEGRKFAWLTVSEHRQFTGDFPHLLSYFWNVLHNYTQKHLRTTVTQARNRQISYHKFYSVVCQVSTYLKNLWSFCMDFEGRCPGWACFLSTKRMRAFHEYCRFRAGSPNTASNKAKYTQEICQFLIAHVACLRDFAGELWIVAQQAGHFRKLMRQQQQVNQINRPNFEKLLRDGKAITAEQLKKVHATVFVKLTKSMECWQDRIGLLSPPETLRVCYNFQTWLQMLCHFKVGGQRQEVIVHMTRENFKFDRELQCFVLRPNFKEKKIRKLVKELCFPRDCTPFFKFFLDKVRLHLIQTDDDPLAVWLSFAHGLPQCPSAMTRGIAKSCAKIIPGSRMTSLRWRHLLVTLAYLDDYIGGQADQQNFLEMLANLQNHDVGTLMRYYNDANISAQATVLINRFNQDFLQSEESNVAAARANDVMPGDQGGDYDQADEVLDDLRSLSEEEVIYSDRYRAKVIAGKQLKNGHLYYLVEWETREPTWERLTSLKQYLDLVEAYEVKSNTEIEAVLANLSKKRKKHGKTKSNKRQKKK
jgi:hypothetical protein